MNTMDSASADRLGIDVALNREHREVLLQHIETLQQKTRQVFNQQDFAPLTDPDAQLYSGGFFSNDDYQRMQRIQRSTPEQLSSLEQSYDDARIPEMLFRYRARNFPATLDSEERQRWEEYRRQKFRDPACGTRTLNQVNAQIEALRTDPNITGTQLAVLDELEKYLQQLAFS